MWLETNFPVEMGGFDKPFNKELEKYETLNLFLNKQELYFDFMNYIENTPDDRFT